MKILLTNDDGPSAPGLPALLRMLRDLGDVTVIVPAEERSGIGHAITYLVPVHTGTAHLADGTELRTLAGTPADCVKFGLLEVFDRAPDLAVAGLNLGINAGVDLFYSGTVAAALEGAFAGVFSIALSTSRENAGRMEAAAREAVRVIRLLLQDRLRSGLGAQAFNVNIPALSGSGPGIRFTRQSQVVPRGGFLRQEGPRGRVHYWLDSTTGAAAPEAGSDVAAVQEGCISITPLRTDLTDAATLVRLAKRGAARARQVPRRAAAAPGQAPRGSGRPAAQGGSLGGSKE